LATLLKVNNDYNLPNIGISSGQAPPPAPLINIQNAQGAYVPQTYVPPPAPTPQTPTWGVTPIRPSPLQSVLRVLSGLASPATAAGKLAGNDASLIAARLTGNQKARQNARLAGQNNLNKLVDTTRQFTTRPAVELISSVIPKQKTFTPNGGVEKALLGSTPIQNIEKKVANNYATHPNLSPAARVALAAGEGLGSLAQDVPIVGGEAKLAGKALKAVKVPEAVNAINAIPKNEIGAVGKNVNPEASPRPREQIISDIQANIKAAKAATGHEPGEFRSIKGSKTGAKSNMTASMKPYWQKHEQLREELNQSKPNVPDENLAKRYQEMGQQIANDNRNALFEVAQKKGFKAEFTPTNTYRYTLTSPEGKTIRAESLSDAYRLIGTNHLKEFEDSYKVTQPTPIPEVPKALQSYIIGHTDIPPEIKTNIASGNDIVTLYHATNNPEAILKSGKLQPEGARLSIEDRKFSENPDHIFLTPNPERAKEFGDKLVQVKLRSGDPNLTNIDSLDYKYRGELPVKPVTQPTQGAKQTSSYLPAPQTAAKEAKAASGPVAETAVSAAKPKLESKAPTKPAAPPQKSVVATPKSLLSPLSKTTTPLTNEEIKIGHALGLDKRQMAAAKSQNALDKAFQTSMADIRAGKNPKVSPDDLASMSGPEQMRVSNYLNSLTAPKRELPKSPNGVAELPKRQPVPTAKYLFSTKVNAIRSIGGKDANDLADRIVNTDREARDLRANWMNQSKTVMSLSKKEFEEAVDVKEGKLPASAVGSRVNKAVAEMSKVFPDVHSQGFGEGLIIGDRGATYFPHSYPNLNKLKGSKLDNDLQYLMDTEQVDHRTATELFNQMAKEGKYPNRFGNFANARLTEMPGYYKDKQAYTSYLQSAAQNIAEARHFGTDNEIANKLIDNIRINGGDNEAAQKALENYLREADRGRLSKPLQAVRGTYGALTLGKAAISHAGQTSNTAVEAGIARTLKGWGEYISQNKEGRSFIDKTGVTNPQELHSYREQLTSFKGIKGKLTAPGLNKIMKINRSVTALAGRAYGNHLAETGNVAKLRELGVTGDIGEKLTESQQIEAARGLVDHTMFSGSRSTTPILAETAAGKTIGQFRTAYAYKQTGFIYNQVVKEARKGNLAPLARYLTVSAAIGAGTVAIKNKISGRKEGPGGIAMDAAAALGGLPGEAASELIRYGIGHHNLTGAVAGELAPLAGEGLNTLEAIDKGGKSAERYALKKIPYVGNRVAQKVTPPAPAPTKTQVAQGAKQPQKGIYQVKAKDGSTKYATLQGKNLKTFSTLKDAQAAQAKNEFKYSSNKVTNINGQVYHKSSSGTVVKGTPPAPSTSSSNLKTVYDPKSNTWTRTNVQTGRTVKIASDGSQTVLDEGLGRITNARSDFVSNITATAQKYGVEPRSALAVAAMEGLSGAVGDNGTSFGPFQLHIGGALPAGKDQAWAESPAGIDYAIQQIAKVAKGKTGADAINAIVSSFERPANPQNEIAGALSVYNGRNVSLNSSSARTYKLSGSKSSGSSSSSGVKAAKATLSAVIKAQKSASAAIKPPKAPAAPKLKTSFKSPGLKKQSGAVSGFSQGSRISVKKNA